MRVVTLLSDFGSRSPYPAQMKAAVLGRCDAALVDITHDVRPHDVREGAYLLRAAVRAFPEGTVHLAVVDPGVGTARRGLALQAGGHTLVGPDNGLLLPAAERLGAARVHVIAAAPGEAAPTFHGRDVFAPVAATLACGGALAAIGPPVSDPVRLSFGEGRRRDGTLVGEVIYIDPFGNVITNVPGALLEDLRGQPVTVALGGRSFEGRVVSTYGEVERATLAVVVGSDGEVEIAAREDSAAARTGAAGGAAVVIAPRRGSAPS